MDRREGPTISDIFSILEKNKETLHIESYLLSQTTLEQIFMSFANKSSRANSFHNKKESFKRNIQPDLFSKYSFETQLEAFGHRGRLGPPAMTSAVSAWRSGTEPASGSYLTRYVDNARRKRTLSAP